GPDGQVTDVRVADLDVEPRPVEVGVVIGQVRPVGALAAAVDDDGGATGVVVGDGQGQAGGVVGVVAGEDGGPDDLRGVLGQGVDGPEVPLLVLRRRHQVAAVGVTDVEGAGDVVLAVRRVGRVDLHGLAQVLALLVGHPDDHV